MKADPRKRTHTMGAKWLRQNSKNPVTFPTEMTRDEGGVISAQKSQSMIRIS